MVFAIFHFTEQVKIALFRLSFFSPDGIAKPFEKGLTKNLFGCFGTDTAVSALDLVDQLLQLRFGAEAHRAAG